MHARVCLVLHRLGPSLSRSPERPNMGPSMHSENVIRNGGYPPQSQSRQQSPGPVAPGLPHSPVSYPGPSISSGGVGPGISAGGGMPSSLSQGGASMMQYASRSQEGGVPPSSSEEWENLQRPQQPFSNGVNGNSASNSRPGSRPNSGSFSRTGGDSYPNPYHNQNGSSNGHMR